jgi:hypothetical protein
MKRLIAAGTAVLATALIVTTAGCAAGTGGPENRTAVPAKLVAAAVHAPAAGAGAISLKGPALPGPGTSVTLSEKTSKAIVAALKTGGTGAAIALCGALLPAEFKDQCSVIVGTLAAGLGVFADLKAGHCIKLTVRLGFPPIRVSVVPCPPPRPPTAGDDSTYSFEPAGGLLRPGEVVIPPSTGGFPSPGTIGALVGTPGGLGVLIP